ncbi:YdcF family protein [Frondihabitans sp. VKM Ac-2883]|jgi:uncharacterized SAM-binding protein YcdF (DUF218 family)|uniref:YdcF family protein n=1 Tax=Frondihabitans sp. VKM Ac-2883 TaxID=2783823 RepID=UPI00188CD1D7|nr:YdcF family protein [Frondihabitans sp. VKM Ac-2883]MBF4577201.1 YdcF family protein [Frondihabitans sp. VKM Ac-2883]
MIVLLVAAAFAVLYVVFRIRDARLLRNGLFLVAAVFLTVIGLTLVLEPVVPWVVEVVNVLIVMAVLSVLVLGVALVANGITMLRLEGRSLGNLLSLVVGVAIFAMPVVAVALLSVGSRVTGSLLVFLSLVGLYFGVAFVSFTVYSVVYGLKRKKGRPAAIVVLGSGLIGGKVPPLLRSRLDRALRLYRSEREAGRHPVLIPSGGQGADEPRPEGVAMAEYLIEQGASPDDVHAETQSRNTRENLLLSRAVQERIDRPGAVTVVTNEYHVLRTAFLARSIGSDAQVIGSRTATYYVPSAFLREFIAVMVEHRRLNLLAVTSFAIVLVGIALATIWQIEPLS